MGTSPASMIPRRIHYCWFGGGALSALNERCMATWRAMLPDYELKRWTEDNSPLDTAYAREAIRRRRWSRLSNYVRLHALGTEGGVYVDTDVEVVRPLDPLLGHECFIGFQLEQHPTDWVNSAVLGAVAGHPFIKACLDRTLSHFEETGDLHRSPAVCTSVLKEMGLRRYGMQEIGGVAVYPRESFYPYSWEEQFTPECVGDTTFCIHHWEASWVRRRGPLLRLVTKLKAAGRGVRRLLPP